MSAVQKSLVLTLALGELIDFIFDGAIVGAAWVVGLGPGIATSIAVFFEELPRQTGNFAVYIYSGCTSLQAILLNGIGAIGAICACSFVLGISEVVDGFQYILPLAAGNFFYVSLANLITLMQQRDNGKFRWNTTVFPVIALIIGMAIQMTIHLIEPLIGTFELEDENED